MADLIWTGPALEQLAAIAEYIALDKPEAAKKVVQKVMDMTERVHRFTKMGRPIPELDHPAYRQVWIPPCWIYYRTEETAVIILHVRRGERPLRTEDLLES